MAFSFATQLAFLAGPLGAISAGRHRLELDGHVIPTQIKDDSMVLRILDKVHTVSDAE